MVIIWFSFHFIHIAKRNTQPCFQWNNLKVQYKSFLSHMIFLWPHTLPMLRVWLALILRNTDYHWQPCSCFNRKPVWRLTSVDHRCLSAFTFQAGCRIERLFLAAGLHSIYNSLRWWSIKFRTSFPLYFTRWVMKNRFYGCSVNHTQGCLIVAWLHQCAPEASKHATRLNL